MAGSEELGLREDTLRVLAAFLKRGEAAGSPIPTPPRPSDSRLLCPRGPAAGTAGPRATEIPAEPRVTGSPTHRKGSPAAEAGGLAGGGGRSHQPEAGLGPCPAPQAGPPLCWLLRPPSGAVLQPGGQPLPQPHTPLLAVPRAPAAFPGAPGPPGPGHGAEPARGLVGGHPGWTQRRARAQLHALDPGPGGLGGHPGQLPRGLELAPGLALPQQLL
ncbi:bcl-2-like protein 12 isoform X2 [Myotis lucifugus]|uniref:bcl-2-like protein 12 isoform X2 n=1 Tax=Myotis lucifugus TaxID=59463 RepID=UPI0006D71414|nr:bcl-2-like protein 12 isoform X2 [Myotis lucifugus]